MSKFLLVDDEANKGWSVVLKAVLFKEFGNEVEFDSVLNRNEAENKLCKKWDIIFLDLRFGEPDHNQMSPEKLTGAIILQEIIRKKGATNFATPVIIFTASRKIWNIDKMIDCGADSYYIKESPYDSSDESFSRANYNRLVKKIKEFLEIGQTRQLFWSRTNQIIEAIKSSIPNTNIRLRIEEKLLIGYALLSGTSREFELKNFLFAKESFAFLVYFSLFEEISKVNYEKDWGRNDDFEWKIMGSDKYLVKKASDLDDIIDVGIIWKGKSYVKADPLIRYDLSSEELEYKKWSDNRLSIREQIIGLLILKFNYPKEKVLQFEELNHHRNKLDFIHSSPEIIMNETFTKNYKKEESLKLCSDMFEFIYKLFIS